MNTKVGGDIQIGGLDEIDSVTVRVVVDVLQFLQNSQAMVTFLLIIWS